MRAALCGVALAGAWLAVVLLTSDPASKPLGVLECGSAHWNADGVFRHQSMLAPGLIAMGEPVRVGYDNLQIGEVTLHAQSLDIGDAARLTGSTLELDHTMWLDGSGLRFERDSERVSFPYAFLDLSTARHNRTATATANDVALDRPSSGPCWPVIGLVGIGCAPP